MNIPRIVLYIVLTAFVIALVLTVLFALPGCKSFSPIWLDKLPAECNMSLNAMRLHYSSADKAGTSPSLEACYKCLHRIRCQAEVFGVDDKGLPLPVDYNNASKYRNYEQCRSELK